MNEFDEELEKALTGWVQITDIGRVTDEKPKHKAWFTANDRLFVLDFTESKRAIKQAIEKHIIGEDEEPDTVRRTRDPDTFEMPLVKDYSLRAKVINDKLADQRKKLRS